MSEPIDILGERWNDVPGFDGIYLASTLGRVFARERFVEWNGTTRRIPARYLKGNHHTGQFHLSWNGEHAMLSPQGVILLSFVRLPEPDEVATVIDEAQPAALGNVAWRRRTDFQAEKCAGNGHGNGAGKLSDGKVRRLLSRDLTTTAKVDAAAAKYGVSRNHVYRLKRGEHWPQVKRPA